MSWVSVLCLFFCFLGPFSRHLGSLVPLTLAFSDGRYGLWLDSSLEKGVSSHCQTFGNEPLADEGEKFEVLGVEVWYVGA